MPWAGVPCHASAHNQPSTSLDRTGSKKNLMKSLARLLHFALLPCLSFVPASRAFRTCLQPVNTRSYQCLELSNPASLAHPIHLPKRPEVHSFGLFFHWAALDVLVLVQEDGAFHFSTIISSGHDNTIPPSAPFVCPSSSRPACHRCFTVISSNISQCEGRSQSFRK